MNVLIHTLYPVLWPHYEWGLEIAQNHFDQGDEVTLCMCKADLPACDFNFDHDSARCLYCVGRAKKGATFLPSQVKNCSLNYLFPLDKKDLVRLPKHFSNINALKSFSIDGFDIGYSVCSSLISLTRDPYPSTFGMSELIWRLLVSAFIAYRSTQNYLMKNKFGRVYVYNGRYAPVRAVLRACQSKGVACWIYEQGYDRDHYTLYENAHCCDLRYIENNIMNYWKSAEKDPQKEEVAAKYYVDRAAGVPYNGCSYVAGQREGMLPQGWDAKKKNIAIFSSSEDEFAAIDEEWTNPIYQDQLDGLRKIVNSLKDEKGIHLYLRMHPNLKKVDNDYMKKIYCLEASNLTTILPEDPVSTYALMKHSDQVLTFGSTTGIEAVFWGVPSILAGKSLYRNLDGTYNPKSHAQLVQCLKMNLQPKSKTAALMYGYYMETFGISFKHYNSAKGTFKNEAVRPVLWMRVIIRLCGQLLPLKRAINKIFFLVLMKKVTGCFVSNDGAEA